MESRTSENVTVGRVTMTTAQAVEHVRNYTDIGPDPRCEKPYAFPAYDQLRTGTGPAELNDGDLLAPVMLNVGISIRAMYGLQELRADLEKALEAAPLEAPLANASHEEIADVVTPLYETLDTARKPQDIGVTKLSKVLHRKRPGFLALHDKWVELAYFGEGGPLTKDASRPWSGYMVELHKAIRNDIVQQARLFEVIRREVPTARALTDVRLVDILAWSSQGGTA